MTDVALLVPPGGQVAYPTLAPAALRGYAASYGIEVTTFDLNLQTFLDVMSPEFVEGAFADLHQRHDEILERVGRFETARDQLAWLSSLDAGQRASLTDVPNRLRDLETFRHETAHWQAMHHLNLVSNLIELCFWPLRFTPGSLLGGMFSSFASYDAKLVAPTPFDEPVRRRLADAQLDRYPVIGLSAFCGDQVTMALRMAPEIRRLAPSALVVLGGNVLLESELPDAFQARLTEVFDAVVTGDGELPLVRLVEVARGGPATLDDVPNAFTKGGRTTARPYKFSFEGGTTPDFTGMEVRDYLLPEPVLPFRLSNGCGYGRCTFCAESVDRGEMTARLVYKENPAEDVAGQFAELGERFGARLFVNCSSLVSAEGAADMGDAIAARRLDVQWMAMVRAERAWLEQSRMERAAAGGASALNFGIESMNLRISRLMKKGIHLDHAPAAMRRARNVGVDVTMYSMVNYPTETLDEYGEHLERVWRDDSAWWDIVFQSEFMMVIDSPAFDSGEHLALNAERDRGQLDQLRKGDQPVYQLTNADGGHAYRWDGDQLPRKLDQYYEQLLDDALRRPLFFDRHLEIVTHLDYWEPEYNMIIKAVGGKRHLPAMSLRDLAQAAITVPPDVRIDPIGSSGVVAVRRESPVGCVYVPQLVGDFLAAVREGSTAAQAFAAMVATKPAAPALLDAYERIHRQLRYYGLIEVTPASDRPGVAPAPASWPPTLARRPARRMIPVSAAATAAVPT